MATSKKKQRSPDTSDDEIETELEVEIDNYGHSRLGCGRMNTAGAGFHGAAPSHRVADVNTGMSDIELLFLGTGTQRLAYR